MSRATYGIDAPGVPFGLTAGGVILLAVSVINSFGGVAAYGVWGPLVGALFLLASAGLYLHATLRGKFRVWSDLLDGLGLRGDEQVLDLGCGRGAVLLAVARRLDTGTATGVDLWRSVDQSGNSLDATRHNAELEGVSAKVRLDTGDMTEIPYPAQAFDLIVSSLAIHNIPAAEGRLKAVDEAARVLRPGGRLVVVDIMHAPTYAARLSELGLADVQLRSLGPRFWFGGPWMATRLVTARRP